MVPPHAKLYYFDIRGLGQAVRLALSEAGVEFDEVRYQGPEWGDVKKAGIESGLMAFGQVPALEYRDADGSLTTLVQSAAIMNFLGREHGMTGATNKELAKMDIVIGGTADVRRKYTDFVFNEKVKTDPAVLDEYKSLLASWLPFFEKLVAGPFVLGEKFTVADIMLFDLLDSCALRPDPKALDGLPKLAALHKAVAQRPGIAKYLASDACHKWSNGAIAFFDTPQNPAVKA